MCDSCGISSCDCNNKRFYGAVDVKQIPGPPGANGTDGTDGTDGAQGIQGIQGIPGVGGNSYEYYKKGTGDEPGQTYGYNWTALLAAQPQTQHTILLDGIYQIHFSSLNESTGVGSPGDIVEGTISMYINGFSKQSYDIKMLLNTNQEHSMIWRGTILNTNVVEFRTVLTTLGGGGITTKAFTMLINKES